MTASSPAELVGLLSSLVAFPTESRQTAANQECFDYLAKFLERRGMVVARHASNDFPSLVATTRKTGHPKVLLQAHIDVVPAHTDSYKLTESDGKLRGRGVFDMKFAAACYLHLAQELRDELGDYDFGIMFTADEEVGGKNGAGFLLDKGYGAKVCVLPDGGNDWGIETGTKGCWFIKLKARGLTAHGSRPWEGDSAINRLIEALADIRKVFGELSEPRSTLTISQISGGSAINQVPEQAEATLDMRFIDDESYADKRAEIEAIASKNGVEIDTLEQDNCGNTDMTNPYVAKFVEIAEDIGDKPVARTRSCGSSDARYFCAKDIPTIVMRPTGGAAHSENEWLDKEEFLKFYEVIKTFVLATAKT